MHTFKLIQDASGWDILGSLSMALTALLTLGLFLLAIFQLNSLIRNNSLKTVLDLESELGLRKLKIDEVIHNLRVADLQHEIDTVLIYADDLNMAIENYINVLERICYCINFGYVKDREWKSEYFRLIISTIRENPEKFGAGTVYRNVVKLYYKWVT